MSAAPATLTALLHGPDQPGLVARVAGWTAHIMEQHANNRIIRPTDQYTGPMGLKVTPIEKR